MASAGDPQGAAFRQTIANRALLGDRPSQASARSSRAASPVAIMVIDLDAFKLINDGSGTALGIYCCARRPSGCPPRCNRS